jgi:hypothetical protein
LALGFSTWVSLGLERLEGVPPARDIANPLGEAGLILSQNTGSGSPGTSIVLLKGPAEPRGPRVVAIPNRPLLYQADPVGPNNTILSLPPIPFSDESPWFLKSMAIDLNLSAARFGLFFNQGFMPFLIYAGGLIFFLSSLSFVVKLSAWPLANLFLGCLAFRGILALETFFNSPEIQDVFKSFLENRLPLSLTVPLIFCLFGLLVRLYSVLVFLARRRSDEEI